MSQRELLLLSPYRLPGQHVLSLGEDDSACFLNGWSALWHPAVLVGAAGPPKIASSYDYEQPFAGHVYAVPESPPLLLPDDWDQRVRDVGAIAFRATPDRAATLANLKDAMQAWTPPEARAAPGEGEAPGEPPRPEPDGSAEAGSSPPASLLELPADQVTPFFGIGLGFLVVNTLFEAMDHENLLAATDLWQDVQQALEALQKGENETYRQHLQTAAERLLNGREILYPSPIYILDICLLEEQRLSEPLPTAFAKELPINLVSSVRVLEKLGQEHPEQLAALRERLHNERLEICSGPYLERDDGLLPLESQTWNLLKGCQVFQELFGCEVRVYGRQRFAAHPQLPMVLSNVGINKALLLAFDNGVLPNWRSALVSWPAPNGKHVETFARMPFAADSPQTFFNLAHYLYKTIREDQTAVLALLHKGKPATPWYEDWLELTCLSPALGQWYPLSRLFAEASAGEYASAASADEFHSDYLEERTTARQAEPVGWFARQVRQRRRLDIVWTLTGIQRGLAGARDPLRFEERVAQLEDQLEMSSAGSLAPDAVSGLAEIQDQLLQALSARLLARAKTEQPGYLVLNPCSFTRRVALELEGITRPLPIDGPIKACQIDPDKARLVVEVPPLGFAWFPQSGPPGTPPMKERMKLADQRGVRNEFFEADVDPRTGGLLALRDHRLRVNRLGQILVFNPGSRMRADEVKVTSAGPALGEVISSGTLRGEQDQVLAQFRQRFRAWLGRPLLELRIEITPLQAPTGYPWHHYFGARFNWGDERVLLVRGVNGCSYITSHTRPETPDYLELRLGQQRTSIFPGGLPFHQRQGTRMLDVILVPEGETTSTFDLGLGIDRDYLMHTAQGMTTPVPLIATTKGPPHVGAVGWLFHVDAPNLLLTSMRPTPDGADALTFRFLEVSNNMVPAELRCVRDPRQAAMVDARGNVLLEATTSGDTVSFEVTACDLAQLRVRFAE